MTKVIALVAVILLVAGCRSGGADDPKVRAAADDLVTTLDLEDVDGPETVTSKSISYLVATGRAPGTTGDVSSKVLRTLEEEGWEIRERAEHRFVANRDGVATQIAVHAQLGINRAPEGTSWVQLSVAEPTDGLDWANP